MREEHPSPSYNNDNVSLPEQQIDQYSTNSSPASIPMSSHDTASELSMRARQELARARSLDPAFIARALYERVQMMFTVITSFPDLTLRRQQRTAFPPNDRSIELQLITDNSPNMKTLTLTSADAHYRGSSAGPLEYCATLELSFF